MLMFGQDPQLPVDFLLGRVQEPEKGTVCECIQERQRSMGVVFQGAREWLQVTALRRREWHD